MNSIQLVLDPLRIVLVLPCCYFTSSVISIIPDNDAISCYANHKAGRMMDGLSDRPRRSAGGHFPESQTLSLVIHLSSPIAFIQPLAHPGYPHWLPLTPHHSPASACHVLGVKGFPPIAHQKGAPPSPAPRTINCLADRDGLGCPRPRTFQRGPRPSNGLLSLTNNRGGPRRSERVKSAAPGRKSSQCNRGKFFSI